MTTFTESYARLADDSYRKEEIGEDAANAEAFEVLKLIDNLEQDDDVQKVYHNLR